MIRSLWIAKTGMDAQQMQLDTISNNLANVSTTAYKRGKVQFEDMLYVNLRQSGANTTEQTQLPTGLQVGTGVASVATRRIFTQGALTQTNNQLDVAVNGQGFFQIGLPDGTTAYSRDGSFHVDSNGQMVTASGFALQPSVTIPPNAESVTIGQDGTVSVKLSGQAALQTIGQLQLASFINEAGLESRGNNLYLETAASGNPTVNTPGQNGLGLIQQGYLEGSNVNVVEELVSMIATQRAYDINSKAIQTSDQMLQRLSQL
ncbi:MAG: flagellar basal-body rod protein FlgG [Burkholderiaceae bacterium]